VKQSQAVRQKGCCGLDQLNNMAKKVEFHIEETKQALNTIAKAKGIERAQLIEQILRCETAHFTSKQWELTKCAGMEDGKWSNLDESKFTKIAMNDNHLTGDKKRRVFLKWDTVLAFCMYLSDYIDRYAGNYARWNRADAVGQAKYRKKIEGIKPRFV